MALALKKLPICRARCEIGRSSSRCKTARAANNLALRYPAPKICGAGWSARQRWHSRAQPPTAPLKFHQRPRLSFPISVRRRRAPPRRFGTRRSRSATAAPPDGSPDRAASLNRRSGRRACELTGDLVEAPRVEAAGFGGRAAPQGAAARAVDHVDYVFFLPRRDMAHTRCSPKCPQGMCAAAAARHF